ncbi:MAG: fructose-bisphosphatase class II family protein, partial [Alphaproteobacteria bacterium]
NAPDTYMEKIAIGPGFSPDILDLDAPIADTLAKLAKEKDAAINDLNVCILERDRHQNLIADVRKAGARITLIGDGDVSAVIATAQEHTGIDLYVGSGGAPEGVLAAAALQCIGGSMLGRLIFRNDMERARAVKWGVKDFDKIYTTRDLAKGDNVMFAATGVTDGTMLRGVRRNVQEAKTSSLVMRSKSKTIRHIEATHNLKHKPLQVF